MKICHKTAFLFPSAGRLFPGVCREYYENYSIVREYFDIASDIHEFDFKEYLTGNNQDCACPGVPELCTMLVSLCKYTIWSAETGIIPEVFTGLSMGLYTSVVAANSVSFADSFMLLKKTMEQGLSLSGKMGVVFGLSYDEVEQLCLKPIFKGRVTIANSIMQNQVAVCGDDDVIELFFEAVRSCDADYKIIYNGQFHVEALKKWSDEMRILMEEMDVNDPEVPILFHFNLLQACSKGDLRNFLSQQVASEVKWYDAVKLLIDRGFKQFVEFGPGDLLTKMIKIDNSDTNCYAIGDPSSIATISKSIVVS